MSCYDCETSQCECAAKMSAEIDALAESAKDWMVYAKSVEAESNRYRSALEEIAGEDYRGNRPWSATRAWQALNGNTDSDGGFS